MIIFVNHNFDEFILKIKCNFRPKRTLHSKKYGADLVRFAQDETCAVHSSTKIDGKILLLQNILIFFLILLNFFIYIIVKKSFFFYFKTLILLIIPYMTYIYFLM